MAQNTEEERKKGGVPVAFGAGARAGAALATGGSGSALAAIAATAQGKAALLLAVASAYFGAIGVGKAMTAADQPRPAAAIQEPRAPAKELPVASAMPSVNAMQVSPMPVSAMPPAAPVAGQGDESIVGAAAVGGPESASALLDQAQAMPGAPEVAAAGAAADGARPNHIVPRKSALKGSRLDGLEHAGVATDGGIGSRLPNAPGPGGNSALQGLGAKPGGPRGFGSAKPTGAVVAAAARSVRAGTARGQLRRAAMAMNAGAGRPGGESGSSLGTQVFDGGAAQNTAVAQSGIGVSQAAQDAAAASESDYGGDGAPLAAPEQPRPGAVFAAAPAVEHKNATPWQGWVDSGKDLMYSAMGLLMIATLLGLLAKKFMALGQPHAAATTLAIAKKMAILAGLCGLAIIALGGKIKTMGQQGQGNELVFTGTLILLSAAIAYIIENKYDAVVQKGVAAQDQAVSAAAAHTVGGAGDKLSLFYQAPKPPPAL